MWLVAVTLCLAAIRCGAEKQEIPAATEVVVVAGRDSPKMICNHSDALSGINWKIGYQKLQSEVLDEKWEEISVVRFEKSEDDSILQIKYVKYEDRSNVKCESQRNVTKLKAEEKNGTITSINVTETKTIASYFRIRVRGNAAVNLLDPIGVAWPTVGVLVEAVVMFIIITLFEYNAQKKSESK